MMYRAVVDPPWSLDAWRGLARAGLRGEVAPEDISWSDTSVDLLGALPLDQVVPRRAAPRVSSRMLALADAVLCHRDPGRHALLYRLLWRLTHDEPGVLETATDADLRRAEALAQAVRRDTHKMKAFVRFREMVEGSDEFVAWFEPEHCIVDRVAPFFVRRFAGMRWTILTPERSLRWDGASLNAGEGATRQDAPAEDAGEALWKTYYAHIFNPARLNVRAMQQEMPRKYWQYLPEAALIPGLVAGAGARSDAMIVREPQPVRRRIPARSAEVAGQQVGLESLRAQVRDCRVCPLWENATQAVFGEGPENARIVVVGEQPGNEEDLSNRPFAGPAGQLLDAVLASLDVDRQRLYVTNAVKHFRFERRGKYRLHRNPEVAHITACAPWLEAELAAIAPAFVLLLGATAARAVLGPGIRVKDARGQWRNIGDGRQAFLTVHPSWILRQPDAARDAALQLFTQDLRTFFATALRGDD